MSSRLLNALLLLVMVLLVGRHLVALLPDRVADVAWMAADTLRAMGLSAAMALCTVLTPWRLLRFKCMGAALAGYYVIDAASCLMWYGWGIGSPTGTVITQGVMFVVVVGVYWFRSYNQPSDGLIPEYVYCIRRIPASTQDFVISLTGMFGSDGGYSIYVDGHVYKFANGVLVRRKMSIIPTDRYHVTRGNLATQKVIDELDHVVGTRWSVRRNCLTVLGRIWYCHT